MLTGLPPGSNAQLSLDSKLKVRYNASETEMMTELTESLARRPKVGLMFACILALSATPACAIQMVRIAQLGEHLGGNYPCGCCRNNGRNAILGMERPPHDDTLVAFEYEGNGRFQRFNTGTVPAWGPWCFGDGDNDGKMEVAGYGYNRDVVIWEAPSDTSFPSESVWSACPYVGGEYDYMHYVDFWQNGHQELGVSVIDSGVDLYENSGDNTYYLAAKLNESSQRGVMASDFAVADFDLDTLMDLVTGSGCFSNLKVYEAIANDSAALVAVCTTGTMANSATRSQTRGGPTRTRAGKQATIAVEGREGRPRHQPRIILHSGPSTPESQEEQASPRRAGSSQPGQRATSLHNRQR